ncbi:MULTISPECIES: spore germination protein [Geobacillus]|jgi:stage V sporulation protein AF|uniref:Stage V sporulation protein AF n=2 Tax=Geobacillus thermodenitrificans TaxID=33940 RepID=A4IQH7_GEOTN|nr:MULTISPECIES: spore germination protein [Geobacillus]ABO67581.1 Stage V sporulation protein AF [Geobacillus thermodenitrificans NG80-2]ARA99271.1 spore germination protein [Geobacillus thermodenitrificans]ARP43335.1 Spore germination protein KA [Geobacillus thermodenitrificans]ATO38569.1 spore germination protein [Geobacillus thermodenitrificans]KQB92791.1 Stage V sporulation protein AF [Geobacillus sp. PA-3]
MPEKEKKGKVPIAEKLVDNAKFLQNRIGVGTSFDLGVRKIHVLNREVHIYYCNGLCDTQYIIELLKQIVRVNDDERQAAQARQIIENRLVHQQVSPVTSLDEAVDQLLSGLIIIFIEGESTGFAVDVRSYPGRQPQEPDTEKVVRGARDGYVENIIVNTALTRRRIRDERLRFEILQVGERSKTDICIAYIQDVADPGLVELVKNELKQINIDGLTMGDKTVEEFLVKQGYNPYPLVRYTERPDVAATHLLEGHVLIMVDTSPSVIITPTTFFHHVQHAEEYRQSPGVGTFVRWVRFLGILSSLFLLPLWMLFVLEPSLLPDSWAFIGPNKQTNIPVVIQILIADFGIEFLRMAAIHTPTPLSTAMGLIAAVLIGQIAIDVGLFVPEVILYVAVAAIGSFATPSYELSIANKICRLALVILVALFKVPGLVIGTTVYFLWLASIRSLNTPYLWPFIPFDPAAFMQIIVRRSTAGAKVRPSIVHPQDQQKQPS